MSDSPKIVLASRSPRRERLLTELGLSFEVVPAAIDEIRAPGEAPAAFARRAAAEKAAAVAERLAAGGRRPWIIAADTVVVLGDDVLGKPEDAADARAMLGRLAGVTHTVITGYTVGRSGEAWRVAHEETAVTFHPLSPAEIAAYAATGEGMDKAGAYAIQGIGSFLVDRIDGDYFNVVGLPVSKVVRALVSAGALPPYPLP